MPPLFDAPWPEPSAAVGFAGNPLDRRSEHREDDAAIKALADPRARVLLAAGGKLWLKAGGGGFDPFFSAGEIGPAGAAEGEAVLLGWAPEGPVLALSPAPGAVPREPVQAADIRDLYTQGLIEAPAMGMVAQAVALLSWHGSHGFCGRCGGRSQMRAGGIKRVCPACGAEHFPRTDPVAIMLAVLPDGGGDGGRCLMGRGRHFAPGMYSCLAGFIEQGETIEAAVRRETFEESGVRLGRVLYHASQPWPFPYSLMIGCFGEALGEAVVPDGAELEDCRWFSRGEVLAMIAGTHAQGLRVPPPGAIATHLIKAWAEAS